MRDVAEFISLLLTFPTIFMGCWVLAAFGQESIRTLKTLYMWSIPSPQSLLILGITVSFLGSVADNVYWWFAWFADFLSLPVRDILFANGVYSNIPFRQGAGIVAAGLHLVAA